MGFAWRRIAAVLLGVMLGSSVWATDTLRVLAWPGYADADLVHDFEKRQGVRVEVTLVNSDDALWEQISARGGADFDVFAVNTAELQRYIDQRLSVPLELANIPNTRRQLPRFSDPRAIPGISRGSAVYAVPYTYAAIGLIYDRKLFRTPPDSWSVLWDPRYKGRVLAYQGSAHNFSIAALTLGLKHPFRIPQAEFSRVARHLVALRRNVLTFYAQPEEASELFVKHGAALLFANYGSQQVKQLQQAGADIGYVIPREGALAWLDCWTVSKGARNQQLAEAWINYTLEPQMSRALTERQGLSNTLEASPFMQDSARLIWLQQVEDPGTRARLWDRILSGDLPERF